MTKLRPHPDRLLPSDPAERAVARRILDEVERAPIYSPHGHVPAALLADNEAFPDPAGLLVTPDHYVTRLLHASGVSLEALGVGKGAHPDGRSVWRSLCEKWDVFAGTPVRYWLETELATVFGVEEVPDATNADDLYDQIAEQLRASSFRPRALFSRFGIRVLATTDDPTDDLGAHRRLSSDPTFDGHVIPTFRADRFMDPSRADWTTALARLAEVSGVSTATHLGLLEALKTRRSAFIDAGATSSDTGVLTAHCQPLGKQDAQRIHAAGIRGEVTAGEAAAYQANMLYRFAEMSADDGLVMQLHAGVIRNHHEPTFTRIGPDSGHDLPAKGGYTQELVPILRDFGTHPNFRIVLFTVDESMFSREIGPLAGFYPSVFAGAPWWFLDSPAAIRRYRNAITDSAGFAKTSGFVDDTRAFCSIPARHDMSRRLDAGHLAGLVTTHELREDEAVEIAKNLVSNTPINAFRLPE